MTPWLVLSRIFTVSVWGCISRQFREVVGDTAPFLLRVYWQKDEDMLSQGDQRCWNVDFIRSRVRFNPRQLAARVKDDIRCGQWNLRIQPLEFRDLSNWQISKRWTKTSHRFEFKKLDVFRAVSQTSWKATPKMISNIWFGDVIILIFGFQWLWFLAPNLYPWELASAKKRKPPDELTPGVQLNSDGNMLETLFKEAIRLENKWRIKNHFYITCFLLKEHNHTIPGNLFFKRKVEQKQWNSCEPGWGGHLPKVLLQTLEENLFTEVAEVAEVVPAVCQAIDEVRNRESFLKIGKSLQKRSSLSLIFKSNVLYHFVPWWSYNK